eukprot:CAMPEP_0113703368 /NCGR_PEP_ID=MMETSP0038_2-20120614/25816_1 /TAXON_ID=2898 /ORGANISM="Cryptomonas paramecium" /LENGTH=63 /DNA_ID=CAMNT_0000627813 /DNA_START=129 /DNA_END=316 /DNA_ORIENTATION=- /assembly_acc=CAM_ASM_000170
MASARRNSGRGSIAGAQVDQPDAVVASSISDYFAVITSVLHCPGDVKWIVDTAAKFYEPKSSV